MSTFEEVRLGNMGNGKGKCHGAQRYRRRAPVSARNALFFKKGVELDYPKGDEDIFAQKFVYQ